MRILVASDLHYSLRQFDWLVHAAPDFDLVVLAGDHLDISSSVECDAQIVVVLRYFELLSGLVPVIASSGNHDLTGCDANGEAAALWLADARSPGVATDGDSLMVGDTLITVCPWWDGPAGREAVAEQLGADAGRRPANWIWVYHWPPVDSPTSWTGHRHYGDADLAGWIGDHRPDIVLTGHVHEPPFKSEGSWADRIGDTWVFNPGRQTGPIPTRIEIDLASHAVAWFSLLGVEELSLTDPVPPRRTVA
jgi:Icc-related predicted phosphoesterase